ncbi:hypothetical protein ACVDG5_013880 [Mesorhizobium sp. ORM6]
MDDVTLNGKICPCVEVVEACGEWFVHVVEEGQQKTLSFELEAFAMSYAEGQRIRLGLDKVMRVSDWFRGTMDVRREQRRFSVRSCVRQREPSCPLA